MKCFVLVLSLVAFAQSMGMGERDIRITDNGVVIYDPYGREIVVARPNSWSGKRNIDIDVRGPKGPMRKVQIADRVQISARGDDEGFDYEEYPERFYQDNGILGDILSEFRGEITEEQYEDLLRRVRIAVERGEVREDVLRVLECLRYYDRPYSFYRYGYPLGRFYQEDQGSAYRYPFYRDYTPLRFFRPLAGRYLEQSALYRPYGYGYQYQSQYPYQRLFKGYPFGGEVEQLREREGLVRSGFQYPYQYQYQYPQSQYYSQSKFYPQSQFYRQSYPLRSLFFNRPGLTSEYRV